MNDYSTVRLRPAQEQIMAYTGGYMGVSAVPGSGKTFTLSLLAARLVERLAAAGSLDDREVLIVTFTNSAVENFRNRIGRFLHERLGLLPGVGYRVRTLHGLAHDIVRERPALVGLAEDFGIVEDRIAADLKRSAVEAYLRRHPDTLAPLIHPNNVANYRQIERYVETDMIDLANHFIRVAKELPAKPHEAQERLRRQSGTWPLLQIGLHVYADYQRGLEARGAVDFDDLIAYALQALDADPNYLSRLQDRWPYILEDEAQDSSLVQERLLRRLTERHGNWVRVGDPNQAIHQTFTGADPRHLRGFVAETHTLRCELPNSGRSAQPVIDLANQLITWSCANATLLAAEPLAPPLIQPTPPSDPQPNPPAGPSAVYFHAAALAPNRELEVVLASLCRWLPDHRDQTVAILSPDNFRGFQITEALELQGIPFDDRLLRTNQTVRAAAQALAMVLAYIAKPHVPKLLERVWRDVWWPRRGAPLAIQFIDPAAAPADGAPTPRKQKLPEPVELFANALQRIGQPEALIFPAPQDWLDTLPWLDEVEWLHSLARAFRADLQRWTRAAILPVYELVLAVGNDLFRDPADLALTHLLAVTLSRADGGSARPALADLAGELEQIAENRRRIVGLTESGGYEPEPGKVTVATMHAAKGLEWDRVYLTAINTYSFPGGGGEDDYRSERWYVRDSLNLVAEALAQLRQLHMGTLDDFAAGAASTQARLELAAERLRLFYVGITRARRELIVTYNTGRRQDKPLAPAAAFTALRQWSQIQSVTR
jgi:DNA helicase-2/ATP-dependent DNA helicase PcrA